MNRRARAGSEVFLTARVFNAKSAPPVLFSPLQGVKVTIRKPDGTAAVTDAVMSSTTTGIFTYAHQTAVGDPVGVWTADFKAQEGTTVVLTLKQQAFILES